MAENTDEENSDNSTKNQTENFQNEIISNDGIETITQNQEPQNMEVHHHAHDPAIPHHKKNWKSYFWEFLMLFLAVFCGFLAEYQLEHQIEKQRAKEYALSLYRDITADTLAYSRNIKNLNICVTKIDSLIVLLGNKNEILNHTEDIYKLSLYAFIFPQNNPNESTIQQLLNSGSLRYFRSNGLIDSIKAYNNSIQLFKDFRQDIGDLNLEFRKAQSRIIELNPIIITVSQTNFSSLEKINLNSMAITSNTQLVTNDETLIKEYANWCALKKFYMANTAKTFSSMKRRADGVLQKLKDEYNFK